MEVTSIESGRSYTVGADGKGARYTSVIAVSPSAGDLEDVARAAEARSAAPTG